MRVKITIAVFALVLIATFLVLGPENADEESAPAEAVPTAAESDPAAGAEAASAAVASVATLATHETIEIPKAWLSADEPLVLKLQLGEPVAGAEPLSGRLLTDGRDPVDITHALRGAGPGVALVEFESGWLSLGRNVIEIKTNERTHLPLRRYVLQVR